MIRNVTDLANALGVEPAETETDTIKRIGRRVYKNTECGAWVALSSVRGPHRPVRYVVRMDDSILGPRATGWRLWGARDGWKGFADAPTALREYLDPYGRDVGKGLIRLPEECGARMAEVREFTRGFDDVRWLNRPDAGRYVAVVTAQETGPEKPGVAVGSIVEGSDAEVMPEVLAFPFTFDRWKRAVQSIEDEADRLWRDANEDEWQPASLPGA